MPNQTQLDRYKKLIAYIEENFKEELNIEKVEAICNYSYRNINRIFEALHHETIGKYIKRLRLEKAAQYLIYTDIEVSDIAYDVGFKERTAFSKAFKSKFGSSPSAFRKNNESLLQEITQNTLLSNEGTERQKLDFEIAYLPEFQYLFLEYRGAFEDIPAITVAWNQLIEYTQQKGILSSTSTFMGEIIDDNEISESINSRHNLAILLSQPTDFQPDGLFRIKTHRAQKYAKFIHEGSLQSHQEYYQKIYALWMLDINLELKDLPVLEFYPNFDEETQLDSFLTEIYIPIK